MKTRLRVVVTGRVQGVGFRPSVFRHATELGLSGCVKNTPEGVLAEVQGDEAAVQSFIRRLKESPPRQAQIEKLTVQEIPLGTDGGFQILPSQRSGDLVVGIPPDLAVCADCAADIADPANRRYRYPFTNCTNCGPRFTLVDELPYDREKTSMAAFKQCPDCEREFTDPSDRRFDAQPNACPVCGPALRLLDAAGRVVKTEDPIRTVAGLLRRGGIVAVKSLGGFHLCCDATSDAAIRRLRERKDRPAKALAVMFQSLEEVKRHCQTNDAETAQLQSGAAPVVVLARRPESGLSRLVSPDTDDVGAFLPYTPLHGLLLAEMSPLVMTSGNLAEEPIIKDEAELPLLLGKIADHALVHNRRIVRRCDDSVVKMVSGERMFLRRSRGWVPAPVPLPLGGPPVLACGAELKNVVCLTRGDKAFMSQHIGDMTEYSSYRFFEGVVEDFSRLLKIRPEIVAHDMHPDYRTTRFAAEYPAPRRLAVQHHHAHIASCMAEQGLTEPVIGIALDGTGFGADGTVWGGEFLVATLKEFRRVGHFKQYRMPGSDEAIRHPPRMAYSCLLSELGADADNHRSSLSAGERTVLARMVETGLHAPLTSSAGRLFDIVSALLGLCDTISYEGQAAVRLQALADRNVSECYPFEIKDEDALILSFGPAIQRIVKDVEDGRRKTEVAGRFHRTVAGAVAEMCAAIRSRESLDKVVLSGGVFQNDLLLGLLTRELQDRGFTVYSHRLAPPNDGCISLGQAAVALAVSNG